MKKNYLEGYKVSVPTEFGDRDGVVISNYSPNHIVEKYYVLLSTGKVVLLKRDEFQVVTPIEKYTPHKLYNSIGYKITSMSDIAERDSFSFDISFCSETKCDNLSCRRNFNRTEGSAPYMRYSVSNFKDKEGYCPTPFEE